MTLGEVAQIIGASVDKNVSKLSFDSVSLDSRQLVSGQLYIAIIGEHFDGHHFVSQTVERGAIAAIVSRPIAANIPILLVSDTIQALFDLAAYHRNRMQVVMMGITGSCGKTTVKNLLNSILALHAPTLSSQRSFNNHIGVPLTLLDLNSSHRYLVCEMGASQPGDIMKLTRIVKPDVAVITNAGEAHLAGFKSVEGVAYAKSEIFQGLSSEGVAVINADDDYALFWEKKAAHCNVMRFGRCRSAQVTAKSVRLNNDLQAEFQLKLPSATVKVRLKIMGEHNVMNALAASAMAYAKGVPIEIIKKGLELTEPMVGRLVVKRGYAGARIIDDTYNANPLSTLSAVKVLVRYSGRCILVLGNMLELGKASEEYHRFLGSEARRLGVSYLYGYGQHAFYATEAFGKKAYYFENSNELIMSLRQILDKDVTLLIKGSNAMKMNKIVSALTDMQQ